jgi:hypothetical protein
MRRSTFYPAILLAVLITVSARGADIPDYEIGDIAIADVLAPMHLYVPNPDATAALKESLDRQLPFIVRHSPFVAEETAIAARNHIAITQRRFLDFLQAALIDEPPSEEHIGSPAYLRAIAQTFSEAGPNFPVELFAPIWTRGEKDESLCEQVIQLLRQTLSAIVVADDAELPPDRALHLAIVKSLDLPPGSRDLEAAMNAPAVPVVRLSDARRHLDASTIAPPALGRFAATFLRPNARPDPLAYERLRARQLDGIIVHDTYEPAQVIVRKGQSIDPAILRALTVLREKTALTRLQYVAAPTPVIADPAASRSLATWIGASLGAIILLLAGILWRLQRQAVHASSHPSSAPPPSSDASLWKQRALSAEAGAERARNALRSGALAWLKTKVARTLFRQRNELLAVQQKAESEVRELEKRVENLQTPLQKRIEAYARRRTENETHSIFDDSHRPLGTRRRADSPSLDAN